MSLSVKSRVSRRLLAFMIVGPWIVVALLIAAFVLAYRIELAKSPSSTVAGPRPDAVPGKPGNWGQLEYRTIRIELPDEFVFVPPPDQPPVRWVFHGSTKDQAIEFLKSAGITPGATGTDRKGQVDAGPATGCPGGVQRSSRATSSSSRSRRRLHAKIYQQLVEFEENTAANRSGVVPRRAEIDESMKDSGLSPSSVELLKSLLYPQGESLLLFADFEPALRRLPNDQERRLFMNAVSRKRTLLAGPAYHFGIEHAVDHRLLGRGRTEEGRRSAVARPAARGRRQDQHHLPAAALRPRTHLYVSLDRQRGRGETQGRLLLVGDELLQRIAQQSRQRHDYLRDLLKTDYATINQATQMGDVIFLATPKDAVIHAAIYIADDIVFTKNGESYTQPWILMHMQDMLDTYLVKHPNSGPLKTIFYRKKTLF